MPLRDRIFTSKFERRVLDAYRRLFSIQEIEHDLTLKSAFGVLLFSFFIGFKDWWEYMYTTPRAIAENVDLCWPYYQHCSQWYVLNTFPDSYAQQTLYMVVFLVCLLIAVLISKKEWVLSHALFVLLWVFKTASVFIMSMHFAENYSYYDIYLGAVLLFFPHKLAFLRLTFVWFYFLASSVKIDNGWILGTYFTSLKAGLPFFSDSLVPIFTSTVLVMQMVGSWFLLSGRRLFRLTALSFFAFFHWYSGILVGFRFPVISLTMLIVLFAINYRPAAIPLDRRSIAGWTFLIFLLCAQLVALVIPGDHRLTLEGDRYGLFMFEANHQCVSSTTVYLTNGTTRRDRSESSIARHRCDPYRYWYQIHEACTQHPDIARVAWTFDHSINGGPFYRIVDTEDACALSYAPFSHNQWIKSTDDDPKIIGYPAENYFSNPFFY